MDFAFIGTAASKTSFSALASFLSGFSLYSITISTKKSSSHHQKQQQSSSSYLAFWSSSSSETDSNSDNNSNNNIKMLSRASGVNRLAFSRAGAFCIPASGKKSPTGEDGFFISGNGRSMGVADGVGGWAEQGVDPSIFTRKFMKYALDISQKPDGISANNEHCSALGIMQSAFNQVLKDKLLGSCAAIFCTLEDKAPVMNQAVAAGEEASSGMTRKQKRRMVDVPTGPFGTLNVANVGDCGVAIIRGGMGVVFNSREQQRSFNFPYQLGPEGDTPASAIMADYHVAAGDIVILGSDGLFDNVYPDMLPGVVFQEWRKKMPKGQFETAMNSGTLSIADLPLIDCESVAETVAKMAYQSGKDRQHLSPFSLRAKMSGLEYPGGKPDDITVVVGQIVDTEGTNGKTELPDYQLIEQFFDKYPLSNIKSKL